MNNNNNAIPSSNKQYARESNNILGLCRQAATGAELSDAPEAVPEGGLSRDLSYQL